jgi:hypothetical protein
MGNKQTVFKIDEGSLFINKEGQYLWENIKDNDKKHVVVERTIVSLDKLPSHTKINLLNESKICCIWFKKISDEGNARHFSLSVMKASKYNTLEFYGYEIHNDDLFHIKDIIKYNINYDSYKFNIYIIENKNIAHLLRLDTNIFNMKKVNTNKIKKIIQYDDCDNSQLDKLCQINLNPSKKKNHSSIV